MGRAEIIDNIEWTLREIEKLDLLKEEYESFQLENPKEDSLYQYYEKSEYVLPDLFRLLLILIVFGIPLWFALPAAGLLAKLVVFAILTAICYFVAQPIKYLLKRIDFFINQEAIREDYEEDCRTFDEESEDLQLPIREATDELRRYSIIPADYWEQEAVQKMLHYFRSLRVDTLKECINLYEIETREDTNTKKLHGAIKDKQKKEELLRQVDEQNRLIEELNEMINNQQSEIEELREAVEPS
jgi:hypothetical protein